MAGLNAYASSLRLDRGSQERQVEKGVPFFVPHLAKVKTQVMCQSKNQHLLFSHEKEPHVASSDKSPATTTLTSVSYRKQGNQQLYSDENLRKRQRLLEDKQVVAAITRFWDTFPHIRLGHQYLEKRDYLDVFLKFYKALVAPSEFSMAEARKIVERDWERDVGDGEISMSKALFVRALFEVADIWTVGIGAEIYVSFLTKLFDRVTMTVFDQEKSMWLTVFAELDKIRSLVEPKDTPSSTNQDQDAGAKPRPPLLKKKTLSVPNGLGSPTKNTSVEPVGGSLRRLPELATPTAITTEVLRAMQSMTSQSPSKRTLVSPEENEVMVHTSRSEGAAMRSPTQRADMSAFVSATVTNGSSSLSAQRGNMSHRKAGNGAINADKPPRPEKEGVNAASDKLTQSPPSDLLPPAPQVHLSMPSIYLSPEITPAHAPERAARRRIRESMKLAQRLRRITF
ncbi:hypothetical protein Poli38472_013571 [Pythium oligandrum]|uniref:Uncharacterized protein n=1 Tax=Pythium oligandrum TaxID=41045 RepID=A0A8K1FJV4_PYTOL|nr:hypothetical protein Poli38472_013571 [Pythium oligandrum]|eukprot:TMW61108.1 hypothetical protein Poli38472_013571 [Pythium oligandrum]